ncbi:MAG: hypothetical protein SV775_08725, partial [Thermodesulfobacteriota bacterium]|nr:hypothetical protein [Thermodesulfobacteriota bacterium]
MFDIDLCGCSVQMDGGICGDHNEVPINHPGCGEFVSFCDASGWWDNYVGGGGISGQPAGEAYLI